MKVFGRFVTIAAGSILIASIVIIAVGLVSGATIEGSP